MIIKENKILFKLRNIDKINAIRELQLQKCNRKDNNRVIYG